MTPQRSPDNSGKKCFLTIFNFLVSTLCLVLAQEEDLVLAQGEDLLVQEKDLLLAQEEDLLAQEEDLPLVQDEGKEWSPEKLKMTKNTFLQNCPGTFGVSCAITIDT